MKRCLLIFCFLLLGRLALGDMSSLCLKQLEEVVQRQNKAMGDARHLICQNYREFRGRPEFKKISKLLNQQSQHWWRPKLASRYLAHCALGGAVVTQGSPKLQVWLDETFDYGSSLPIGPHSSNYVKGFTGMVLMDQCFKAIVPRAHGAILLSTLGVNTLLNIYLELDIPNFPQPDFVGAYIDNKRPSEAKDIVTDIPDFVSGTLATISYAALSLWVERTTWINKARLCR